MFGRGRSHIGAEPMTARNPLRVRLLLAMVYIPVFAAGAVLFGVWGLWSQAGDSPDPGVLMALSFICAVLALLALGEAVGIHHRRERARTRHEDTEEEPEPDAPEEPGRPEQRPDGQERHGPGRGIG
ncbi:hypothetical protein [Streptomyces sp. MUM 178J]|uniref:hypothetical protein n=1 Tax=Streptomyces sp. MUM 178J TaxID=2791991 RepID=UPI001F03A880|nr:hypothetical protein [Streptomyces sp. MUM 178J]WRQ78085.1 hypothetical protein I3F59_001070 [Streptomyces sp. MUM 178J]